MRAAQVQQATTTGGIEVIALANAATIVGIAAYVLCAIVAFALPDVYFGFFQSWFHGISLEALRSPGPAFQFGAFVTGLITFGASVWLAAAATASLYNKGIRR